MVESVKYESLNFLQYFLKFVRQYTHTKYLIMMTRRRLIAIENIF